MPPTRIRGSREEYGSWKTIWRSRRRRRSSRPRSAREVGAVQGDRTGVGPVQAHQQAAEGGLAAAGLADQAEGLAAAECQGDLGHRVHDALPAARHAAAAHRELPYQPPRFEQRRIGGVPAGTGSAGVRRGGGPRRRPGGAGRLGAVGRVPAGVPVLVGAGEPRLLLAAPVGGVRAAGGETAAARRVGEVRRQPRDGGEQPGRVLGRAGARRPAGSGCTGGACRGRAGRCRCSRRCGRRTSR